MIKLYYHLLQERVEGVHKAIEESNWNVVKDLLSEEGSLLKAADRTGLPPLHKAVVLGKTEIVENIVRDFIDALTVTDHVC